MSQQSKELVCCKSDQAVLLHKTIRGPPISFRLKARGTSYVPHLAPAPLPFLLHPHHHLNPCTLHSRCTALAAFFQLTGPVHLQSPPPGMPFPWESVRLLPHLHLLKWYLMGTPSRTTLSAHPLTPRLSLLHSSSLSLLRSST